MSHDVIDTMKLVHIIDIVTETLKNTSKDLAQVVRIITVVVNALNQQGYIDTTRGIEAETLEKDDIELVNQIIEQVLDESE